MPGRSMEPVNLYRPAFELNAALLWALSAIVSWAVCAATAGWSAGVGIGIGAVSMAMAWWRARQAWQLFRAKAALASHELWAVPSAYIDAQLRACDQRLWLGRGFRWTGRHTELALHIQRAGPQGLLPPRWALRLMGKTADSSQIKGEPWIHGLEPGEQAIAIPWEHGEGNWTLFGTSGAGKTRLYALLAYQIIKRGDVLVFFDPKFDKDLRQTLVGACDAAGRHDAFCEFLPAFPERSVRIDTTRNFSRSTEIASRIADILGATPNDSFMAFGWRVMQALTQGLLYVGERPSLKSLHRHLESGPEALMERCLRHFLDQWAPGSWEDRLRRHEERLAARTLQTRLKTGTAKQRALVQVYHDLVPAAARADAVSDLISVAEHPREHYFKMIAGLIPLLTQLTAAPLGELLSPDDDAAEDAREILDMEKVIRDRRVLYVATDSLVDGAVGSAIAAVLLAELRAVAGARYNAGVSDPTRIHIICDEACELVTPPLIALMSKGRGAGMICYLATQTFSDYIWRFGSEDAARMVLGNGNNRLCLRVVDSKTQRYMAESLGETMIQRSAASMSISGRTQEPGAEVHSLSQSVNEQPAALFPGYLLGQLPDLHYVAAISGGKVYKGRIPRMVQHAQSH